MCTVNNDIKTLKKLRALGHVLIPVYKYYSERFYNYTFRKGWNIAKCCHSTRNMTKKSPYSENAKINESFHFYLKELRDRRIQQTFWIYADEITACENWEKWGERVKVVTCSRAFIKQLNKRFVDNKRLIVA